MSFVYDAVIYVPWAVYQPLKRNTHPSCPETPCSIPGASRRRATNDITWGRATEAGRQSERRGGSRVAWRGGGRDPGEGREAV